MTSPPPPVVYPHEMFRFHVHFDEHPFTTADTLGTPQPICQGAFVECTGLEATMEPKVIKEGGRNVGANQRAGPVTFGTVVPKRGITATRDLWTWFDLVTNKHSMAYRLAATINVYDHEGTAVLAWRLAHCIPVKFKGGDLNAKGSEVGIEELHLAHEGMSIVAASHPTIESIYRT